MDNNKSWDNVWDKVFAEQEWGKYPSENLIQFIARNYYKKDRKQIKILEVGCGTGANIWYTSREGFDSYGIDGSTVAVEIANQRMRNEFLDAKFIVGDIVNLPFADGFFDVVIDNECIYSNNTENSRKILNQIRRVLNDTGTLYSRTFSDKMYVGKENKKHGANEYSDISDGPLANKGFVRLSSIQSIKDLYNDFSNLVIDYLEYSSHNQAFITSEYVIIAKK